MKSARWLAALAVVLMVAGAIGIRLFRSVRKSDAPAGKNPLSGEGRILSPQGDRAVYFSEENGATKVWVAARGEPAGRLLAVVSAHRARNAAWSPDGRLVAFESYDASGHSPMTTTEVWVASPESGRTLQLRPPPPNERFATYLDRWVSNDSVRIRSTLLDAPDDVCYLFDWRTGRLEGPAGCGR